MCLRNLLVLVVAFNNLTGTLAAATPHPAPLNVATSHDYPPFSFLDEGAARGFDILMAERLGRDLGRPVAFVTVRWPDLLPQGHAGSFDVAMSGVTVRSDRLPVFAFTRPYALTGAVAVVRAEDGNRLRRAEDLNRRDIRVAVNAGGHLERVARALFSRAAITPVADNASLAGLLRGRKVDAVISDSAEARAWRPYGFVVFGPFTRDRKAYAVPLAHVDSIPTLDAWLAEREGDGFVDAQRRTWLGATASHSAEEMCLEAIASVIETRFQLMPYVAAAKHRDGLPVTDLRQERRVLDSMWAATREVGLDPRTARPLIRRLIRLSKHIQRATPPAAVANLIDIATLRLAIQTATTQLIAELHRCQPALRQPAVESALRAAMVPMSASLPLNQSDVAGLAAAVRRVRADEQRTDRENRALGGRQRRSINSIR